MFNGGKMSVQQISLTELKTKIAADRLTIVDFFADWCGPCKRLSPILDIIETESHGEFSVHKVNVEDEEFQEFTSTFKISSIPTVLFFKNGKVVHSFIGLQAKESIKEMIEA